MDISSRTKKLTEKYSIQPEDLMFADALHAGWGKAEGAYFAYHLAYFDQQRILKWLNEKTKASPGIMQCVEDLKEEDAAARRKLREAEVKVREEQKRMGRKRQKEVTEESLRSKQGMLDYLIELAATPGLDLKTRADIAKQITDLQNYKKEEIKEEDSRIHFYLPITCNKCELFKKHKEETINATDQEHQGV